MKTIMKTVKVPVRIDELDETIRKIKYQALDRAMEEARMLGNLAIRCAISFDLEKTLAAPGDSSDDRIPLDTRVDRILKSRRKYLNSGSVSTLGRNLALKLYRNSNRDAWEGKKSLPTYRALFVPFRSESTSVSNHSEKGKTQFLIEPSGFKREWPTDAMISGLPGTEGLKLKPHQKNLRLISSLSKKDTRSLATMRKIVSGEHKLCDSQIQKCGKELMAILSYKCSPASHELDPEKVCGVDLGVVIPAVCAVNFGLQRLYLGNGEEVRAARAKFRAQRRRKQQTRGLHSKSTQWERSEKEKNWIDTYYHALTRQVIKFCIQHGCGTIHMEDLSSLRKTEVDIEYKRLLWIPTTFQNLLSYKAKEAGIAVVMVNPVNTSRRCSACGHTSKANRRSQADFVCEKCGDPKKPVKADYNAAKNIALASGEVINSGYPSGR